jgi:hypothetical protein
MGTVITLTQDAQVPRVRELSPSSLRQLGFDSLTTEELQLLSACAAETLRDRVGAVLATHMGLVDDIPLGGSDENFAQMIINEHVPDANNIVRNELDDVIGVLTRVASRYGS